MMKRILTLIWLAGAAGILGCGKSGETPEPTPPASATPAGSPDAAPSASPAQPSGDALGAVKATADQAVAATKAAAAEWTDKLAASLQPSADSVLKDIGEDIVTRVQAAADAFQAEASLQDQLKGSVEALSGGKDTEAVGFLGKLSQAKLSAEQQKTLGDLKNAVNAFVVQRNFSSLNDADTELGKVVSALRGGDTATALAQLQQMTSKVSLTPEQSTLLTELAGQYAPALQDAGKALEEGLKGINPFGQ